MNCHPAFFTCLIPLSFIPIQGKSQGIDFIDITEASGINYEHQNCSVPGGLTLTDCNGDGWDDLTFGSCPGEPVYIYLNSSSQVFVPFQDSNGALEEDVHRSMCSNWIDFDNDGDDDLFISNQDESLKLFRNDGNDLLVDITFDAGIDTTSQVIPAVSVAIGQG